MESGNNRRNQQNPGKITEIRKNSMKTGKLNKSLEKSMKSWKNQWNRGKSLKNGKLNKILEKSLTGEELHGWKDFLFAHLDLKYGQEMMACGLNVWWDVYKKCSVMCEVCGKNFVVCSLCAKWGAPIPQTPPHGPLPPPIFAADKSNLARPIHI